MHPILIVALTACLSKERALTFFDDDGDGAYTEGGAGEGAVAPFDCDDDDATSFPGATETCDDKDNDCNGTIDDGDDRESVYVDADGDGYGAGEPVLVCDAAGFAATGDDCDDESGTVYPGGMELCGGADEDCDGATDEAGAAGSEAWWLDDDGDGFGDPDEPLDACVQPAGYTDNPDDCDDLSNTANPNRGETCDGEDNDCDDAVDEAGATGGTAFYRDEDKDKYGDVEVSVTACAAPAGYVASSDDCDDQNAKAAPGLAEVCNDGADNNCNNNVDQCKLSGTIDLATKASQTLFGKNANDHLGIAVAGGDLNNDGVDDLVIATEGPASSDGGSVRVIYGGPNFNLTTAQVTLLGGAVAARPLALCVDDVTGDARDDLVVGWGRASAGARPDYTVYSGAALGGSTTTASGFHFTNPAATTSQVNVACGQLKRTAGDLLLATFSAGSWYYGPITGGRSLTTSDQSTETFGDYRALDVDGDGWDDLWRHGPNESGTTITYGPQPLPVTPDLTLSGGTDFAQYIDVGDINGDGRPDLVATDVTDQSGKGSVHVWFGAVSRRTGNVGGATDDRTIFGVTSSGALAFASVAPSLDGDDQADLLVSARAAAASTPSVAWGVYGVSVSGSDVTVGTDLTFNVPASAGVSAVQVQSGDWNGDAASDLLWQIPRSAGNSEAGTLYVVFGVAP